MQNAKTELIESARKKFSRYKALSQQLGEAAAWEAMLEGFPEIQRQRMGPLLARPTLAEAFREAIPQFKTIGMEMEVVDISNRGIDAVLEIQRICPWLEVCKEFGFETPCHVICELDTAATRRAFPEMNGEILCRQALGAPVCIFEYDRPAKASSGHGAAST
ncbi:transcriptional regulator [Chlorobaculum thiosulfatiphilum]|uniref:Transcriptional regulator n=1 Tax=Chlorobaculum thiosulfatiphilum TaxID=115852 RepID=A0A5C4SAD8_CHLTI|nr:L-2-amino-thiazoline-4-carboxylic acid hydrolase [Chlorobaculum thiosulfatiphilum]TNJ40205.1 transcriptional regulator [Chlorobaculum thiosulfatiphilum]